MREQNTYAPAHALSHGATGPATRRAVSREPEPDDRRQGPGQRGGSRVAGRSAGAPGASARHRAVLGASPDEHGTAPTVRPAGRGTDAGPNTRPGAGHVTSAEDEAGMGDALLWRDQPRYQAIRGRGRCRRVSKKPRRSNRVRPGSLPLSSAGRRGTGVCAYRSGFRGVPRLPLRPSLRRHTTRGAEDAWALSPSSAALRRGPDRAPGRRRCRRR